MGDSSNERMQEENLRALVKNGGFQFIGTFFPYTSGQIGPYYVQSVVVEKDGQDYRHAIQSMEKLIVWDLGLDGFDVISGGESRDWDFSNPISFDMTKPHAKIYKDGKLLGADMNGKRVIHIADLSNEGSSPRDLWVPAIRKAGGQISNIFFYVDRMEEGIEVMKELGLHSEAVVPLDQRAWGHLKAWGVVDESVYRQLSERGSTKEERDAWAKKMLTSEGGLQKLVELLQIEDISKSKNILVKGYPDIKDEVVDRLKILGVYWRFEEDIVRFSGA